MTSDERAFRRRSGRTLSRTGRLGRDDTCRRLIAKGGIHLSGFIYGGCWLLSTAHDAYWDEYNSNACVGPILAAAHWHADASHVRHFTLMLHS